MNRPDRFARATLEGIILKLVKGKDVSESDIYTIIRSKYPHLYRRLPAVLGFMTHASYPKLHTYLHEGVRFYGIPVIEEEEIFAPIGCELESGRTSIFSAFPHLTLLDAWQTEEREFYGLSGFDGIEGGDDDE